MYAIEAFDGYHWNQVYTHQDLTECKKAFDHRCVTDPKQRYRVVAILAYSESHADSTTEEPGKGEKPEKPKSQVNNRKR